MTIQTVQASSRTVAFPPVCRVATVYRRCKEEHISRRVFVRTTEESQAGVETSLEDVSGTLTEVDRSTTVEQQAEKTAKKLASTFAPRPSGNVKNPATRGTWLYDLFGYQAIVGAVVGGFLSFNILFPSEQPTIARLLGMWSIWMFSVPSLRARECTAAEKSALNILFLFLPLVNIILPFGWKSFSFVFSADVVTCLAVYYWKLSRADATSNE